MTGKETDRDREGTRQVAQVWLDALHDAGLLNPDPAVEEDAIRIASLVLHALDPLRPGCQVCSPAGGSLHQSASSLASLVVESAILGHQAQMRDFIDGFSMLEDAACEYLESTGEMDGGAAREVGRFFRHFLAYASERRTTETHSTSTKHLDTLKEEFLSIASHELKTPLTSVKAYAQMAQRQLNRRFPEYRAGPKAPPELAKMSEYLSVINGQVDRLCRLINELLDVSRIQAGRLEVRSQPLDLTDLARRTVDGFEATVETKRVRFSPHDEPLPVEGDDDRLSQVILNLVENAHMYSPMIAPVEVSTGIDHCQASGRGWAKVIVRDHGIGIAPSDLPHIFERFHQCSNSGDRHARGMGIGLFVSAEIAKRHDGEIKATSELGKGSTFTLRLPLLASGQEQGG